MLISGIYTITNILDKKIYVGSSIDINNRFEQHKKYLLYKRHHNKKLQLDYNKLGKDNFVYEILEEQPPYLIREIETYWINILNTTNNKYGYNCYSRWNKQGISNKNSVVALTKEGHYIGDFISCGEASRILGITSLGCHQCKKGYITHTKGIVIRSLKDYKENGFEKRSPIFYNSPSMNTDNFQKCEDIKVTICNSFYEAMSESNNEFKEFFELIRQKDI